MKKSALLILVIIIVVAAGAAALVVNKKSDKLTTSSTMSGMNMPKSNSNSSSSTKAVATNQVAINNFAFSPADITISVGTTVTWTNNDIVGHTITETDGQDGPKSGTLATGKSYVFTFDKPGTYHYHCAIHPQMIGTITVTQ